jgi:hypothetical protein
MFLHRQVQLRVGGIQVGVATTAVRQPTHPHLPEHGGQRPGVAGLHTAAGHLPGAGHIAQPLFALRPQVQMILEQLPHQLS